MSSPGPRSLADQLRDWPDERLRRLLADRPDLATPAPQDSSQLASRAATRSSLLRALDQLDRLQLATLDALVIGAAEDEAGLTRVVHADPAGVRAALERLEDLALVWRSPLGLRALSGLSDCLSASPVGTSGLRTCGTAAPAPGLQERIAGLSDRARAALTHVVDHGGQATTDERPPPSGKAPRTPVEELLAARLLVARDGGPTMLVPGEVGLALRGGRTTADRVDAAPTLLTSDRDQSTVDHIAAGAAFEAARRVELLLDHWGTAPPAGLRSGGLGVREQRATAALLQVEEPVAVLLAEVAYAAGLVAVASGTDGNPRWMPTDEVDRWTQLSTAERWLVLAQAWRDSPRMPGLVGSRDPAGKLWAALSPELSGAHQAETRRMTLAALRALPPGEVLAAGTGPASVVERLSWQRPRRPALRADQVGWALREAAELGVTGFGGLSSYGGSLLDGEPAAAEKALTDLLPQPVEQVLLQADLTAVAPGPLEAGVARRLHTLADVESRGGATVYRFTGLLGAPGPSTSAGGALEIHAFLAEVSQNAGAAAAELPGRRHRPDLRAGAGGRRRGLPARRRRVRPARPPPRPPGRAAGPAPPRAHRAGLLHARWTCCSPGSASSGRPRSSRPPTAPCTWPGPRRTGPGRRASTVARAAPTWPPARSATRPGSAPSSPPSGPATRRPPHAPAGRPLTPTDALAALREAAERGAAVVIEYVDNHGARTTRVVEPRAVEGGTLRAVDRRTEETRGFAVHRITGVSPCRSPREDPAHHPAHHPVTTPARP